jgi:folate-dependent phosphoribosylglycinamide formyltransferase PurN
MSASISIVMLAGEGDSTNIIYNALSKDFRIAKVVLEDPVPRAQFLRRRVKRLGLRVVAGQVLFQGAVVPLLRRSSRERVLQIRSSQGLDDTAIPTRDILRVSSANAQETIGALRELRPSIVIVNGTRILSKSVLQSVPARFVNTHAGITPLYRGVHGGYWALANRDRAACGVTVHLVDEGIDTGSILGQAIIRPTERDNFVTYPYLQVAAALPLLIASVRALSEGTVLPLSPPRGASRLWTHPTIGQYVWHRVLNRVL